MSRRLPSGLVLGVLAAVALCAPATALAQAEPVKPYIVFITDVSGSMTTDTNAGPASCIGAGSSRLDHAKCAIQNIANSYGEMVMALARFRQSTTDTNCANGCSMSAINCDPDGDGTGCTQDSNQTTGCTAAMENGDRFELLVPLVDGNQSSIVGWTDFSCTGACSQNPGELDDGGWTPLAGSLVGAKRYWQGLDSPSEGPYWSGPGDDPIREDPLNDVFTSPGEQCRPYITILLTDGEETCASSFTDTTNAASSMLVTSVDALNYRIETKPIGFGIAPGNSEIEQIAHAGGNPGDGDGGANEGAYAQNEEELQIEISAIIADAIKNESCNGLDDDCDTEIDEDFTFGACDDGEEGICLGTGTLMCNASQTGTECVITDPGQPPAPSETCNGLDDDCDGNVDEGANCQCLDVELCNNDDDDCDGEIDEDLTRPCGTDLGVCTAGTETCVAGDWVGCTATTGGAESCNGLDDDCDGTVDGFAEECSDIPGGNPNTGPCHPGTAVCPSDGSGEFGECIGEVGPAPTESCDLVDNDCDTFIDEDTGGADCSSSCGVGTTVCINGQIECDSQAQPDDDTCNGIDDDCDTFIDEDAPPGGACDGGGTICNGNLVCMNGGYVCVGEGIEPELCNCEDDNCNTEVDEGDICPGTSTCVHPNQGGFDCQCAEACAAGEFPCPIGRVCVEGFCLVDPCNGVTCVPNQDGDKTECVGGECVRSCDLLTNCPTGFVCYGPTGTCEPDDCTTFPERCTGDQLCVGGECVSDPCAGVTCGTGEYCFEGDCYGSCADIECPTGQRCRLGECEPEPCDPVCNNQVCNEETGECQDDLCPNAMCPEGERCNPLDGQCEQDPCVGVTCPGTDQVCVEGTCDVPQIGPDASTDEPEEHVTPGGGGGCDAGGANGGGLALLLLAIGAAVRRRRRAEVRS
jgi:uncharacterized protein (TIGR03382 family)